MTASEKCCSNIVCTLLSWCARGLHGNRDGITWLWRTIRANQWDNVERQEKQKDSDQNHKSCFLSLLFLLCQKMSVCFVFGCFFSPPFLVYHGLTVYASLDDCCQFIGCTGGEKNTNALFSLFLRHWLTFNNDVAVTLQSKSFKWNLMWNSLMKYYFMGL